MTIQSILKNFGLKEKDIAVYLSLIELGPSSVRAIAAKSGVNRGTSYDILKSLIAIGLVSYFNKESKQYFVAESPEKLISAVTDKQKQLEEVKDQISDSMPELKSIFEKQGGKPTVKLYEGSKGIRSIMEDILNTLNKGDEYYVYSSSNVRKNVYLAMPDFSSKRIKKGIKVKTIALGEGGQLVGLDERKWLNSDKATKATYEFIYKNKVAHISLDNSENPVAVLIENQEIYDTQKMIFEFNWNSL